MKLIDNIPVCGAPDEGRKQISTCARTADADMADEGGTLREAAFTNHRIATSGSAES